VQIQIGAYKNPGIRVTMSMALFGRQLGAQYREPDGNMLLDVDCLSGPKEIQTSTFPVTG